MYRLQGIDEDTVMPVYMYITMTTDEDESVQSTIEKEVQQQSTLHGVDLYLRELIKTQLGASVCEVIKIDKDCGLYKLFKVRGANSHGMTTYNVTVKLNKLENQSDPYELHVAIDARLHS